MDVFFSMPCSSPLKQLQTSFQKPSGWGSPPTMTHETVLLILHIFRYWLWLNTLMGRPKYIMSLFFLHKLQWTGILVRESTPLTSLLFSLMFPNRWEDPLVLNHHLRLDPSNMHSLQQPTPIILWGKQRCVYDLEKGDTWPWKSACFTKPDPSKPSFFQQLRAVFPPLWHQLRFGTPGLMIERVWEVNLWLS